jgi:hypothetical protein
MSSAFGLGFEGVATADCTEVGAGTEGIVLLEGPPGPE